MKRRHESGGEQEGTKEGNQGNFPQAPQPKRRKGQQDSAAEAKSEDQDRPQRFIHPDVYNKINPAEMKKYQIEISTDGIEQAFNTLENLTWSMFPPERPSPEKVEINRDDVYVIGEKDDNKGIKWIDGEEQINILRNCYVINSGATTRKIIHHYGKDGEDKSTYLMINDWIFLVKHQHLYVYPVGKRLDEDQRVEEKKTEIMNLIESQNKGGKENYDKIRNGITKGEKNSYPYDVISIFTKQRTDKTVKIEKDVKKYMEMLEAELFLTWYFTASVISESARNFRTFPLTLMVLDMAKNNVEGAWNMLFDEHPMAQGGSWINVNLRGFRGSAAPVIPSSTDSKKELDEKEKQERNKQLDKLKEVLEKELEIFRKWEEFILPEKPLDRMETLIINYEIFDDGKQFQEDYNNFKEAVTQEENGEACEIGEVASASGLLGGYGDSFVTMKESENGKNLNICRP